MKYVKIYVSIKLNADIALSNLNPKIWLTKQSSKGRERHSLSLISNINFTRVCKITLWSKIAIKQEEPKANANKKNEADGGSSPHCLFLWLDL